MTTPHPHSKIANSTNKVFDTNIHDKQRSGHPLTVLASVTNNVFKNELDKSIEKGIHPHSQIAKKTLDLFTKKEEKKDGDEEPEMQATGQYQGLPEMQGKTPEDDEMSDLTDSVNVIDVGPIQGDQRQKYQGTKDRKKSATKKPIMSFGKDDDGNLQCNYDSDRYLLIGMVDDYCMLYDKVKDKIYNHSLNDEEDQDIIDGGEDDDEQDQDDDEEYDEEYEEHIKTKKEIGEEIERKFITNEKSLQSMAEQFKHEIPDCDKGKTVKECYRSAARIYHPDKTHTGDTAKMQKLNNYKDDCEKDGVTEECYTKNDTSTQGNINTGTYESEEGLGMDIPQEPPEETDNSTDTVATYDNIRTDPSEEGPRQQRENTDNDTDTVATYDNTRTGSSEEGPREKPRENTDNDSAIAREMAAEEEREDRERDQQNQICKDYVPESTKGDGNCLFHAFIGSYKNQITNKHPRNEGGNNQYNKLDVKDLYHSFVNTNDSDNINNLPLLKDIKPKSENDDAILLRYLAANWLEKNKNKVLPYQFDGDINRAQTLGQLIQETHNTKNIDTFIRDFATDPNLWGGEDTIMALSALFKVNIRTCTSDGKTVGNTKYRFTYGKSPNGIIPPNNQFNVDLKNAPDHPKDMLNKENYENFQVGKNLTIVINYNADFSKRESGNHYQSMKEKPKTRSGREPKPNPNFRDGATEKEVDDVAGPGTPTIGSENAPSHWSPASESQQPQQGGGKIHLTKDELDRLNKRILGSIKKIVN